jgi:hypothetical protein
MNIFELMTLIAIIIASYFCGKWLGSQYGIIGWILGLILGSTLGVTAFVVLHRLIDIWYKWRPLRPICRQGKCSSDDYELIELSNAGAVFRCRCGMKYLKNNRCFMEILDDGSTCAYMRRHSMFGRWKRES